MAEQWYSIVEYARSFNISDMTVRRRIKTGKLHAVLRDGKYYIPVEPSSRPNSEQKPQQATPPIISRPVLPKDKPLVQPAPGQNQNFTVPNAGPSLGQMFPSYVPDNLRANIRQNEAPSIDTNALLSYCEASLKEFRQMEEKIKITYAAKEAELEAKLKAKNLEISQLKQQVEDLQVLVKILERKQA